ncbi:FG-GAP repeat domain-containing protein [Hymenobacter daeguensis]
MPRPSLFFLAQWLVGSGLLWPTTVGAQVRAEVVMHPRANVAAVPSSSPVTARFARPLPAASAVGLQVFSAQRGGRRTREATPATVQGSSLHWAPTAYPYQPGETVQYTVTRAAGPGAPRVGQFTTAVERPSRAAFVPGPALDLDPFTVPVDLAVGDLDGDGRLDVVAAVPDPKSGFRGVVKVRLNTGRGRFRNAPDVEAGVDVRAVVLADADGDGDLDLLLANAEDGTAQTCLNQGNGRFRTRATTQVGASPASIAVGDVDGDGDLDLVTANYYDSTLSVRRNNGRGVFGSRQDADVRVGKWPYCIVLADVDGDGDLDLLAAHGDSANTVSVRRNTGSGRFGGTQEVRVGRGGENGSAPHGLVVGDVDGDGDLDLLLALAGRPAVGVCRNDGRGGFGRAREVGVAPGGNERTDPFDVALGDVDGDGDLDLFAANNDAAGTVSVRRNDGRGGFTGPQELTVGSYSGNLGLGDIDGDGDLDMVVLTMGGLTGAAVQLNNGTQPRPRPLPPKPPRQPAVPLKARK